MIAADELAYSNAAGAVVESARLPDRIFTEEWNIFAFFPSDRLFDVEFESTAREIMRIESAKSICLLNLCAANRAASQEKVKVFIGNSDRAGEYLSAISTGGPKYAWIYNVDRYVIASDVGSWCIQCERENDIAVIAFRANEVCNNVEQIIAKLGAKSINWIARNKSEGEFPFNSLTDRWMVALMRSYEVPGSGLNTVEPGVRS